MHYKTYQRAMKVLTDAIQYICNYHRWDGNDADQAAIEVLQQAQAELHDER